MLFISIASPITPLLCRDSNPLYILAGFLQQIANSFLIISLESFNLSHWPADKTIFIKCILFWFQYIFITVASHAKIYTLFPLSYKSPKCPCLMMITDIFVASAVINLALYIMDSTQNATNLLEIGLRPCTSIFNITYYVSVGNVYSEARWTYVQTEFLRMKESMLPASTHPS